MDNRIEDLLRKEIENQIKGLSGFESGSAEKLRAIKGVAELYKLKIEEEKAVTEATDKSEKREMEKARDAVDATDKTERRQLEKTRNEVDSTDKSERREIDKARNEAEVSYHKSEEDYRKEQLAEQRKDRFVHICIAGAELVLPLVFYAAWMRRGLKFEETGTFTSTTFRGLFNRFRPTK